MQLLELPRVGRLAGTVLCAARPRVVALLLAAALSAFAQDPPHGQAQKITCSDCHLPHTVNGDQYDSPAGNANVCLSCHQHGGVASGQPFAAAAQAQLWNGTASGADRGTSHRWDANPSGRVVGLGGLPSWGLSTDGVFSGRFPRTYTITIIAGGGVGTARFDWTATGPGPGATSGSNVVTAKSVALDQGIVLRFVNYRPAPAYTVGDRWQILARPDLDLPSNPDMVIAMSGGQAVCSTCHNQHSQENEPFDPAAPPFLYTGTGSGRHFMRLPNDTDQMCQECHAPRFVTNVLAGSHPVGVLIRTNAALRLPTTLPLDKHEGKLWCSTCHQPHESPANDGHLLRAASESQLCAECHSGVDMATPAIHLNPAIGARWPGGQYGSLAPADDDPAHRGGCGSCHRAHGWPDSANPANDYPNLLVEREENLCYTCHDGSPQTKNLRVNFAKPYNHPVSLSGRHASGEDGQPARYGTANRHAECVDCHNPHQLDKDYVNAPAPYASRMLRGVARVSVTNVTVQSVAYTFRGAADPTPVREYEVCFTCHSGWTTRPSGQSDLALEFNDKNQSFHPVEGPGKNLNINPNAFVNGWGPTNVMTCSDCHTSDDTTIRGPHGSAYRYILKKAYTASPAQRTMASTEICFDCHRYDTYANNSASSTIRNYSRFSGSEGHTYHVGSRRYPCYTCHETHGATSQSSLLVLGRSPGITTFTRTATGGSCDPSCHGAESYSVTYPR